MSYYVYILRCGDGCLYTGITTDMQRRLAEHSEGSGRGAKYTRSHGVERVEALWSTADRSLASRLEWRIKRLTRKQKQELIADNGKFSGYFGEDAAELYKREDIQL